MTIGLPKGLLYYRFGALWNTFFSELGCGVAASPDTCLATLTKGAALSVGECCLPLKLFLGHVAGLAGRCDFILVPRFETFEKNEEFCVRFWGLPDIVRNTFPDAPILSYNLQGRRKDSERRGFLAMGKRLGKSAGETLRAYRSALTEQQRQDRVSAQRQRMLFQIGGPKVLLVSQPYIIHDPYIGDPLVRMLREEGGVPVFSDRCERQACRAGSKTITTDLYWTIHEEIIGAIPLLKDEVDGVLLVTSFPCGSDSLVHELVLRRVKGLPVAQIILDEQQGLAGLQTRIESFMDIVHERKRAYVQ